MHYCCLVFTKEEPDYWNVSEALEPFEEEAYYQLDEKDRDPRIPFLFDFKGYGGGGRFFGVLAMQGETVEEAKKANRVSASLSEPLNVDYIVEERCFCFVDVDGKGYARRFFDYELEEWVEDPDFEERAREVFRTRKDCYVTVVDIHD